MSSNRFTASLPKSAQILSAPLASEQDVVTARQRTRQVAEAVGFDRQDQARIATAVSEIARNALQYGRGGTLELALNYSGDAPALQIVISDRGPGVRNVAEILNGQYRSKTGMGLGITGARRLTDDFDLRSEAGRGTTVTMRKYLPRGSPCSDSSAAAEIAGRIRASRPANSLDELQVQNYQLVKALDDLRQREEDLHRLNQELEDTNRGVMALYAELDDKAASLRRADELKSRFLSHVSHEFRTPLNSILALTRLLLGRIDGGLTPEQDRQIGYIRKAAQDLTDMVNDLLDLAKVEAGKTVIHATRFSLANLFGALRGMMRPLQIQDNVELIIDEPDPALVLCTDEGKVAQVLRNLVSNALKFTEQGEVRVRIEQNRDEFAFVVSDTGIGIPPEHQERIFQEFAQVENPLQKTTKGTGLGLPLSRKIAELLEGSLSLSSELGRGSTFRFALPAHVVLAGGECENLPTSSARAPVERSHSNTLLVIDDDEVSRYLVRQFLREYNLVVAEAENGSTGLDRARFDLPQVILLDLSMPDLSGFEVLERLREDPDTASIPVIIYTSRTLTATDQARILPSASAVLSKRDLTQEKFVAELRRFITNLSMQTETK